MKYTIDLHTHTIASGHAYSTLIENAKMAFNKGMTIMGVSDHAPKMPGSVTSLYFNNLRVLPEYIEGVRVLKGVELNVLNERGEVDLTLEDMSTLDYGIASLHSPCYDNLGEKGNTLALINAMKNEKVKIIGHPDDSRLPLDLELLVKEAKIHDVLLEVNNSSLSPNSFRKNGRENYLKMLKYCIQHSVPILVGSDAHFASYIGEFSEVILLLESIEFPEELIVNTSESKLFKYL